MKAYLHLDKALRLIGTDEKGHETFFDTTESGGGLDSAASPMETLLESLAACMAMDVVPILRKQRRTVTDFWVDLTAERANEHPRVFTKIEMDIYLVSPDATEHDLERAIELSETKYCSASAMIKRSGCEITWKATLRKPDTTV
jgi:putative redox protein